MTTEEKIAKLVDAVTGVLLSVAVLYQRFDPENEPNCLRLLGILKGLDELK